VNSPKHATHQSLAGSTCACWRCRRSGRHLHRGRVLALALPATVGALLRYVVASVVLVVAAALLEGRLPRLRRDQLLGTLALGATGVLAYNLFFLARWPGFP